MHECFNWDNIQKLPPPQRARAKAAADGSLEDANFFFQVILSSPTPSQRILLPIYWVILDNKPIPTLLRQIKSRNPEILDRVADSVLLVAQGALRSVNFLILAKAATPDCFADLWPRLYPWLQALNTLLQTPTADQAGSILPPESTKELYSAMASTLTLLWQHADGSFRQYIHDEAQGLGVVVGGIWKALVRFRYPEGVHNSAFHLARDFGRNLWGSANRMAELVEGVGGRVSTIGALLVEHIQLAISRANGRVEDRDIRIVFPASDILAVASVSSETTIAFTQAALEAGIVPAAATAAFALGNHPNAAFARSGVANFLTFLRAAFLVKDPARWMAQALRASLLPVVLLFVRGCKNDGPGREDTAYYLKTIRECLADSLPAMTMRFSVLMQLRVSLEQLRRQLDVNAFFPQGELRDLWERFLQLAGERISLAERFKDAFGAEDLTACSNDSCKGKCKPEDLKRCARCHTSAYCSKECQAADWKKRHKAECGKQQKLLTSGEELSEVQLMRFRTQDANFMQALVLSDLAAPAVSSILGPALVRAYHTHTPGVINANPHILLDYTALATGVQPSVCGPSTLPEGCPFGGTPGSAKMQVVFVKLRALGDSASAHWMKIVLAADRFACGVDARRVASGIGQGKPEDAGGDVDYVRSWAEGTSSSGDESTSAPAKGMDELVGLVGSLSVESA
ncbi:MYND-type domain-containing protein [Mycena kentingensis (nom. inval.)]|nr:MYND-type domain-containing protein [Mycena kentingensis (nom. inval.)]